MWIHRASSLLAAVLLPQLVAPFASQRVSSLSSSLLAFYNDFEGYLGEDVSNGNNNNNNDDNEQEDWFVALRARQESLERAKKQSLQGWRTQPTQLVGFPIPDWVRRVAIDCSSNNNNNHNGNRMDVVVGGSSGSLYLVNLQKGPQFTLPSVHSSGGEQYDPVLIRYMYGEYDGGGIIGLARKDALVASSGREGGVHLSLVVANEEKKRLRPLGKIPGLKATATSMVFDQSDILWVGSFEDGTVRGYNTEDIAVTKDKSSINSIPLLHEIKLKSGITSLSIQEEIGCGVAGTAKDGIVLFSLTDGAVLETWNPFAPTGRFWNPFEQTNSGFARSVALVQNDEAPPSQETTMRTAPSWSVVVGGSDGSLHQRQLNILPTEGLVNPNTPWNAMGPPHATPQRLSHKEAVVSLVSPGPGLLLSAGRDGTIRSWDCSYLQEVKNETSGNFAEDMWIRGVFGSGSKPRPLAGMSGYKVWLGSLVILNGNKLVTDGADNTVIVHSFGKDEDS